MAAQRRIQLLRAIDEGRLSDVEALIGKHPEWLDSTFEDLDGRTPLHTALFSRRDAIARLLVGLGANVNTLVVNGTRPLDLAQEIEVVEFLVAAGAGVNNRDPRGRTRLHGPGDSAIDRFLVEHGAEVNARDFDLRTPLHIACLRLDDLDRVAGLMELGASPRLRDRYGKTVFDFVDMAEEYESGRKAGLVELLEERLS